jgi:hypothetical protein
LRNRKSTRSPPVFKVLLTLLIIVMSLPQKLVNLSILTQLIIILILIAIQCTSSHDYLLFFSFFLFKTDTHWLVIVVDVPYSCLLVLLLKQWNLLFSVPVLPPKPLIMLSRFVLMYILTVHLSLIILIARCIETVLCSASIWTLVIKRFQRVFPHTILSYFSY